MPGAKPKGKGEIETAYVANHDLREVFSRANADRRRESGHTLRKYLTSKQDRQMLNSFGHQQQRRRGRVGAATGRGRQAGRDRQQAAGDRQADGHPKTGCAVPARRLTGSPSAACARALRRGDGNGHKGCKTQSLRCASAVRPGSSSWPLPGRSLSRLRTTARPICSSRIRPGTWARAKAWRPQHRGMSTSGPSTCGSRRRH